MCVTEKRKQNSVSDFVSNSEKKIMELELYLTWIKWKIGDMQNDDSSCDIRNDVLQNPKD